MVDMVSVTRQLADLLANTSYADLPRKTIDATRRSILDWLGSALAGSAERPARIAQKIAAQLGTSDEATVFGAARASAAAAALANGVASHILELDDVHKGSTLHAAAPIIPAALAIAEREHAPGRSFVAAVALGYEAAFRIGEAVNPSHYRFWHPTGTAATFGAAAAAGSLLRLTKEQMLHALGTAGTQASGLFEFNADGAMSKHLHPGKAALNGILSADLARAGFTGASRILEGERGFFRATSVTYDASRITDGLGERWKIEENCYKLHSCCGHTHTAVDVALQLRAQQNWHEQDALADIAEIHIEMYGPGYEVVKELSPRSSYQAKFSIAYCVAAALLEGRVGLEQFTDDRFRSGGIGPDSMSELLRRVRVTVEADLTQRYPSAWPARVTLTLRDGCKIKGTSDFPRGNPENPVSTLELEEKFRSLIEPRFGTGTVIAALRALEQLEAYEDMAGAFHDLVSTNHEPVPR
jgi:2-methylcitrate dehydratase PrpD